MRMYLQSIAIYISTMTDNYAMRKYDLVKNIIDKNEQI